MALLIPCFIYSPAKISFLCLSSKELFQRTRTNMNYNSQMLLEWQNMSLTPVICDARMQILNPCIQ